MMFLRTKRALAIAAASAVLIMPSVGMRAARRLTSSRRARPARLSPNTARDLPTRNRGERRKIVEAQLRSKRQQARFESFKTMMDEEYDFNRTEEMFVECLERRDGKSLGWIRTPAAFAKSRLHQGLDDKVCPTVQTWFADFSSVKFDGNFSQCSESISVRVIAKSDLKHCDTCMKGIIKTILKDPYFLGDMTLCDDVTHIVYKGTDILVRVQQTASDSTAEYASNDDETSAPVGCQLVFAENGELLTEDWVDRQ